MNLLSTLEGSLLEDFFPRGWDLDRLDACCTHRPETILDRQNHWHSEFQPVSCEHIYDLDTYMGHEIAMQIKLAKDRGEKLAIILPVGPVGMYRWTVYFLKAWNVNSSHVYGFNMDEWSDAEGSTLAPTNSGSFQYVMEKEFYGPLGELTVPESQRFYATKNMLPQYAERIQELKAQGAKLVVVYGVGRVFHIAFWEPHFADEYSNESDWKKATHRIAARLHPLTVEQNAITSFKSRTTLVPCRANTIGPGLFLQADYAIGGMDGALGRGMGWQGMSLWTTLRYGTSPWIPSSYMPGLKGKLFFLKELAGPLEPNLN
jgi:glucosamine-6-phosphate deaminase